jgi:hypothetical protein
MSPFYRNVIDIWLKAKKSLEENQIKDPSQEIIWNNECIKRSGKTLYFTDWIKAGFIKMSSLFDNNGYLLPMADINATVQKPGGVMLEYLALQIAIPKNWKRPRKRIANTINNFDIGLSFKSEFYPLHKCTPKILRNIMISNISCKPICELFWERKFPNHEFAWNAIWEKVPLTIKEARLITLNWKILSNIYPTKIMLEKMGKANSNKCETCNVVDYLEHFFFYCKEIEQIWQESNAIITQKVNKRLNFQLPMFCLATSMKIKTIITTLLIYSS